MTIPFSSTQSADNNTQPRPFETEVQLTIFVSYYIHLLYDVNNWQHATDATDCPNSVYDSTRKLRLLLRYSQSDKFYLATSIYVTSLLFHKKN
jgi:hypothetical protein